MFNEIQIAHAEYRAYNAKFNNQRERDGVTVQVPNIVDRFVSAVRSALAGKQTSKRRVAGIKQTMATAK